MMIDNRTPPVTPAVAAVVASYPPAALAAFLELRRMVFEAALALDVGVLQETLKWGEPAYLTTETKAGTTLRIAWKKSKPEQIGLYVNCQTSLVERFRHQFPDSFDFDGNRGLLMSCNKAIPEKTLGGVIAATLTYHRNK